MSDNKKNLEDELKVISDKMDKPNISLQEIDALYLQAENLCGNADEEEQSVSVIMRYSEIFFYSYDRSKDYFLQKGKENITDQELDLLEKIVDRFQENALKFTNDEIPLNVKDQYKNFDDFASWVEKDTNEAKSLIQEERLNRKNRVEKEKSVQNTQQIQKPQKEIDSLNTQLIELQKQIGELLELLKKSQDSNDQSAKQEIQQKLVSAQARQQEVQAQLESKKQVQQKVLEKSKEKETNSQTQNKNDKFNWLYVVIPGGILLVISGIVIAYLVGKKNKKD